MALKATTGTPFVGYLSFAAAGGPTAIPIWVTAGSATPYALGAAEYLVLTNITISTNDATARLVTLDDGAATPKNMLKAYVSTTQVVQESIPPGVALVQKRAQNVRATLAALGAFTVEISIKGFITST
jgi:hypothetical protein